MKTIAGEAGVAMAFMAMMGANSVAYHGANVRRRADDHPGQALEYCASRGETPLVCGGSGATDLGLSGRVGSEQFHALYGPGGAVHPSTGERLVRTKRPGMELVIAASKSVAELGVIGRAEHMHRILDAERDATLAYPDRLFVQQGGRRGDAAVATRTGGLVYAMSRHATSRAGDPNSHGHVLVANLVHMADERGGWNAAHTNLLREHLHAAPFGRVAAADVEPRAWVTPTLASGQGVEMPLDYPSNEEAAAVSPTRPAWAAQDHHEPILLAYLRKYPSSAFQRKLIELDQGDEGVGPRGDLRRPRLLRSHL